MGEVRTPKSGVSISGRAGTTCYRPAAAKRRIWHGGRRFGRHSISHREAHSACFLVPLSACGRAYAYGVACDYASSVCAQLRDTVAEIAVFGYRRSEEHTSELQ